MFFDARAVLAEILQNPQAPVATPATPATNPPESAAVSQMSQVSQGVNPEIRKIAPAPASPGRGARPGCMVRLAWSGEWVSADRYAVMTDLERHGPQGRLFCGKCWQYRDRETALGCLSGEACQ